MTILLFLAILVVLIIAHELGHFVVAKRLGIRVDEFGVGFPPRAVTLFTKGETTYTLNWLPIGGFVKIFGENGVEEGVSEEEKKRCFAYKQKWAQALVLVAGVSANALLAWLIFFVIFLTSPTTLLPEDKFAATEGVKLTVAEVLPDSSAAQAGLLVGDTLFSLASDDDVLQVRTPTEASDFIQEHAAHEIVFTVNRNGKMESISTRATPGMFEGEPERLAVGIGMTLTGDVHLSVLGALKESLSFTLFVLSDIVHTLFSLIAGAFTFSADLSQLTGPVGLVGLTGVAAAGGVISVLIFTAFISLNLTIVNLIPIPALDGGRLLFVLIEAIKGSPIRPRVANIVNTVGFALLIFLMVAVTYRDILNLIG